MHTQINKKYHAKALTMTFEFSLLDAVKILFGAKAKADFHILAEKDPGYVAPGDAEITVSLIEKKEPGELTRDAILKAKRKLDNGRRAPDRERKEAIAALCRVRPPWERRELPNKLLINNSGQEQ